MLISMSICTYNAGVACACSVLCMRVLEAWVLQYCGFFAYVLIDSANNLFLHVILLQKHEEIK